MAVYRAETSFQNGKTFTIAVIEENETDAKHDMYTVINMESGMPFGMIRIHDLRKSNRRILSRLRAVKNCVTHHADGTPSQWAWMS